MINKYKTVTDKMAYLLNAAVFFAAQKYGEMPCAGRPGTCKKDAPW
jgi:hypothetical protein